MNTKHIIKYIPIILCLTIILFFSIALFKNINYVKVPNSDFFQYIDEGSQYIKLKLPPNIGVPPLSPILICLLSRIFHSIKYPELLSAHLINIICSIFILTNIFIILYQKNKPWIGLATILLLATNKIYFINSLNVTNEVVYTYFLTLIVLAYLKKRYKTSYLLSGLTFLVRYEAIILPIIIFTFEYLKKTKRFKFSNLLIAFLPIIIWLITLNFHSEEGISIFQNHYIAEIIAGKSDIPNPQPKNSLLDALLSNPVDFYLYRIFYPNNYPTIPTKISNTIFPLIIFSLCLIKIIPKKNNTITKIIFSYLLAHIIFLSVFPNFQIRYLFPVFWIIYLTIIDRKNKIVAIILSTILLIINMSTTYQNSWYNDNQNKSEYRLIAEWLNQQNLNTPTDIIIYEYRITEYFLSQTQNIAFNEWILNGDANNSDKIFTNCNDNILCVLKIISENKQPKNQLIFITTSNSSPNNINDLDDQYFAQKSHLKAFMDQNLSNEDRQYLKLITELKQDDYHWAKIYQYQPQ